MASIVTTTMAPVAPTAPSSRAQAMSSWQNALRQRTKVLRSIEELKKGAGDTTVEKQQFKKLDDALATFRLAFVVTLGHDLTYAYEENAEEVAWKLHCFVNQAYRDLLQKILKGQEHTVARRKVKDHCVSFLKTAAMFYRTYFERLQELHGMPQIPRINRVLKLKNPESLSPQHDQISGEALETSFHATLLHLGDISRWKSKLRSNSGGSGHTGLYYELAHDLKPTSGLAHHQLGILEDSNHLSIVYHLYRAAAIETPHPNALANLEQEFRKLSNLSQPKRSFPPNPNGAFADWFSKLHAYLYKGETYPQELEQEVLGRLETALKNPDALSLILKMVLTNIAAYYIAKSKIQKEWSLKASTSCQFILRLNVRWVVVLSRLLQTELQDSTKVAAPAAENLASQDGEGSKRASRSIIFTDMILPLSRIYMAWLYINRNDLVDYQDHLGPYVFEMYKSLASSLTMMANEFNSGVVAASRYLLDEDVEALGMKPFDDGNLAPVCSLHYEPNKASFKRHWEDCDFPRSSPEEEMLSRVYDWINCGFALTLDARFPLSFSSGPDEAIAVVYLEVGKQVVSTSTLADPGQMFEQLEPEGQTSQPLQPMDQNGAGRDLYMDAVYDGPSDSFILGAALPQPVSPTINDLLEAEPNSRIKQRMQSLVDDLLDDDSTDPVPHSERSNTGPRTTATAMYEQGAYTHAQQGMKLGRDTMSASGSGSSGLAHLGDRYGGSMDSLQDATSPYPPQAPKRNGRPFAATGVNKGDGRVDSVSPPIFGFNSSWTRAFDPNNSSLPPVNSPWGLPEAQLGVKANDAVTRQDTSANYQYYPAAQNLGQHRMPQYESPSNGSTYNSSAPRGRGGVPGTTNDVAHARNAMSVSSVDVSLQSVNAYGTALPALAPKR